jgi:hypothetical protein
MNVGMVALAGFMTLGTTFAGTPQFPMMTQPIIAQENSPQPVEPQQNDRRAAIAKINPQKPIQIRVVSQTTVPVVASLGAAVGDRPVAPGKSVTFGRLHTRYLSLPIDLQVSLKNSPDPANPIRLFLDVKTVGNEVIVGVRTSLTGSGNSSQTVDIDQKGLIYIF